jgi:competence protein ComEC
MAARCAVLMSLVVSFSWPLLSAAQTSTAKALDIYVIDVEGGEATLFVSPSGQSMLVDAGWPGLNGRDADRIAGIARLAGLEQIDYLVVTHFHGDHVGGTPQLAARLPIRHFIDRGSAADLSERETAALQPYMDVRNKGIHIHGKPGDDIPLAGLNVQIIAAGGALLRKPLAGAGRPNPLCAGFKFQGEEITQRSGNAEDDRSLSLFITHGKFRTIIMGDLNWNKEFELMCPNNLLGIVDLYLVSHHGSETSGSEAFVHALRPRVAIMNNGARKGGAVQTFQILRASPGLEDFWQNHHSIAGGTEHNRPEPFIANLEETSASTDGTQSTVPTHMGAAHWIKVSAHDDGSFIVTNSRNAFSKTYRPAN